MLKNILLASAVSLGTLAGVLSANAQGNIFNPDADCAAILSDNMENAALWTFGYLSHFEGENRVITPASIDAMKAELSAACESENGVSFVQLVDLYYNPAPVSPTSSDPQALIDLFKRKGADLKQTILALRPTPEDIHTVFAEPLASQLLEMYDDLYGRRLVGENFPTPFVVADSGFTTTMKLPEDPVLAKMSSGFEKVFDQFQVDVPIGLIHIVFPTVSDDFKLDGMIYVNGHWVLMMTPWRAL